VKTECLPVFPAQIECQPVFLAKTECLPVFPAGKIRKEKKKQQP
jgi:hypothetical protein